MPLDATSPETLNLLSEKASRLLRAHDREVAMDAAMSQAKHKEPTWHMQANPLS